MQFNLPYHSCKSGTIKDLLPSGFKHVTMRNTKWITIRGEEQKKRNAKRNTTVVTKQK